jgi:hypothetical protein
VVRAHESRWHLRVFLLVHPVLTWSIDTPVLKEELVTGMRLMGVTSLSELKPEMVECLPP